MEISSSKIKKVINVENGRIVDSELFNLVTGSRIKCVGYEFAISYVLPGKLFGRKKFVTSFDMTVTESDDDGFLLEYSDHGIDWLIRVHYHVDDNSDTIKKSLEINCSAPNVFIEYIDLDSFDTTGASFVWTIPLATKRVYVPSYVTTMGQPYYVEDIFFGGEFPMADNRIVDGITHAKYHIGRKFSEIAPSGVYNTVCFVMGAGIGNSFDKMRASFFQYVATFSRPAKFRVQFNSWYDHMLDITSDKVMGSFMEVAQGFKEAGYRPLDCYVVDDGWIDYKRPAFWEFDKASFSNEFHNESELTKSLESTFGVWFGPRGGYTAQTIKYAKMLKKLGYHVCNQSYDICTGDPRYIKDLCDKMAQFCKDYNVTYFKIDGFANTPCRSKNHGHPKGKGDGLYFYTFLWEEWLKGFENIRKVCPDVFLNITSYAHCSPWFLKWADAVWLNNCGDMGYEGEGSNLDQCLNYRDGKYKDFFDARQLQFPTANIYNHEPCYAERNYNPPLPSPKHQTVVYSYDEFEKYMYMCMMRGTGFVELYFSPSMFDAKRWKIATKVLQWAEKNFDIIKNSQFFGDEPASGGVYGYYAFDGKNAIMSLRNSSNQPKTYILDNKARCFVQSAYTISEYYPTKQAGEKVEKNANYKITLQPYEAKIFNIKLVKD